MSEINKTIGGFSRIRPFITEEKATMLLTSAVISDFTYCRSIWLICSQTTNKNINRANKRALNILFGD